MTLWRLMIILTLIGLADARSVSAQAPLAAPQEVVLYVHADLEDDAFVDPLVCELSRVLVAPVRAQPIQLAIGADLMASASQLDVEKVAVRLLQATVHDDGKRTYRFLLVPYDLRGGPYRYVFGASFGAPYNNGVVSTARIAPDRNGLMGSQATQVTVGRAYKILVRYVAQLAGLRNSNGCVLAMPRGLEELDHKPATFCDGDQAALVDGGVLKPRPSGGACSPVASRATDRIANR